MIIKPLKPISLDDFLKDVKTTTEETVANPIKITEEIKGENKWYMPKLWINSPEMWESQPMENRKHWTDEMATKTCLGNCCGVEGLKSACCTLDPNDIEHVLGPLNEKWIKEIIDFFQKKGINYRRSDIVIDFEEGVLIGRAFFNGHKVFETPTSYPFLRFQVAGPRFNCKFLNPDNGKCSIYLQRPDMCRNYLCEYVKKNYLVKIKSKPNTWQKLA